MAFVIIAELQLPPCLKYLELQKSFKKQKYLQGVSQEMSHRKNYAAIENERCGCMHETTLKACDVLVENVQNDVDVMLFIKLDLYIYIYILHVFIYINL